MMTFYRIGQPGVACIDLESCPVLTQRALWIDLFEPTQDEEKTLEAALGFEVCSFPNDLVGGAPLRFL